MQVFRGGAQREHGKGRAVDHGSRAHVDRPVAAGQEWNARPVAELDFAQGDVRRAVLRGPTAHAAKSQRAGVQPLPRALVLAAPVALLGVDLPRAGGKTNLA